MRRTFGRLLLSLALFAPVSGFVSCAENFTTSRKSNEEGMRLYSEKAYGDAAGAFRDAVKQEPRDYQSHFYLGVCYDELKQPQKAFDEFKTATSVMNDSTVGRRDDAFRQLVLDTYASCVARYDSREVELNDIEKRAHQNQTSNNWFLLAKVYRLRGDADNALVAYRSAATADIWDFYIRKEIGLYMLDPLGMKQEAAYYLQQAHRLNPNDLAVNTGLTQLGINPLPAYEAGDHKIQPPVAPEQQAQPVQRTSPQPERKPNPTANLPRD